MPILRTTRLLLSTVAACLLLEGAAGAAAPSVKSFDLPDRTQWKPEGCRPTPANDPILGTRSRWRFMHSDSAASDEVSIALAPAFEPTWHAENDFVIPAGVVFDQQGNLYFAPFWPHEDLALISLDPDTGARRWAIPGTGAPTGATTPFTLDDPEHPGQDIVYVALKDRAFAVRTDGTIVWDVPTGLALTGNGNRDSTTGANYLPQRDAVVGLTTSGEMYLLDRATGAQLLAQPLSLPGTLSPLGPGPGLTDAMVEQVEADVGQFIKYPPGSTFRGFLAALLGNGIEVSNSFAIDPNSGRMWVAATAPDDADGAADGVSNLGAIYGIDAVEAEGSLQLQIACRRDFEGGSATTPTLSADGSRVYVADNVGNVIALDSDCGNVWSIAVGGQVTGSVSASSDKGEIYVSTQDDLVKVVDQGASASIAWVADLDVYNHGDPLFDTFNSQIAGTAANGVAFMAAVGAPVGSVSATAALPVKVGYGVADRETGKVRYFADGLDESVAVMNIGPDGAYYNANFPVRRSISRVLLAAASAPLEGGVRKFQPKRLDLLVRDALCAAADRAVNAAAQAPTCSEGAAADSVQIGELLAQVEAAGPEALATGDLTAAKWTRVAALVAGAETATLADQATLLPRACAVVAPCDPAPRSGCKAAASSKVAISRKIDAVPNADKFSWSWSKGDAFDAASLGDPSKDADLGVCVYADADASPRLLYEAAVPASSSWTVKDASASWKSTLGEEHGLSGLKVKGGEAAKTSIKLKAAGVTWPQRTFAVKVPLVVQMVNAETGECWSSRFETVDVDQTTATSFKASDPQ